MTNETTDLADLTDGQPPAGKRSRRTADRWPTHRARSLNRRGRRRRAQIAIAAQQAAKTRRR